MCLFLVPFFADKTKIENMKCKIKKVNETEKVKTKMKNENEKVNANDKKANIHQKHKFSAQKYKQQLEKT